MPEHAPAMRELALDVAAQAVREAVAVEARRFAPELARGTGREPTDLAACRDVVADGGLGFGELGNQQVFVWHAPIMTGPCDRPGHRQISTLRPAGARLFVVTEAVRFPQARHPVRTYEA